MATKYPVITIDGPGGTGKGTVSRLLAQKLGWHFLESGSLYRVLALAAGQHAVALDNEAALEVLAAHLDVQFKTSDNETASVILEGIDVTDAIHTEKCGNAASKIAVLPKVRTALLERQRAFLEAPGLVTDGRDMGTVVFPEAQLKVFLDATLAIRAERRYRQLKEKGISVSLDRIFEEIAERDKRDRHREIAPLKAAADAVVIDTTDLSVEQVLERVLREVQARFSEAVYEA